MPEPFREGDGDSGSSAVQLHESRSQIKPRLLVGSVQELIHIGDAQTGNDIIADGVYSGGFCWPTVMGARHVPAACRVPNDPGPV